MPLTHLTATITGWPGRFIIRKSLYLLNLFTFSVLALVEWYRNNNIFERRSYNKTVAQIIFTGIDALPTITLLGLATGLIFTFRLIGIIDSLGATDDMVNLLVTLIFLGIGPFIAAVILISRTGSAIVVDLGNMKLHGEIDGLELLGVNINEYLVAPRLIGTAVSQLAITVYFTFLALVFGIILSGLMLSTAHFDLLYTVAAAFTPTVVLLFIVKNILFGFVIAATACYHGLAVRTSPTEVPQQATRAIVYSLIMIFVLNGLMAVASF